MLPLIPGLPTIRLWVQSLLRLLLCLTLLVLRSAACMHTLLTCFLRLRVLLLLLLLLTPPPPLGLCLRISLWLLLLLLIFLSSFARVRSSLSDADTHLASLLSSGRPASSILPQRLSQYAVHGDFSSSAAVPVNPFLLSMFERSLRPSLQLGITLREAGLMESSSRFHSEALSHSMWLLSALLAFVRLQGFAPADASLFNTLVTSLSRCLAHQASIFASFTAFLGLKCRDFYLSHLPAYFSEANKRAMLAAPIVGSTSLFAESDVACLLADTQMSSSLRSQQALVDVVSRGSGACRRHSSPYRSPAWTSPARHRRRSSGSPARSEKRVRFDSPAPSSALRGGKQGFRR